MQEAHLVKLYRAGAHTVSELEELSASRARPCTQHERARQAVGRDIPLFTGNSHGRISQPAIRRRLARLDAPTTLWEDLPDTTIGEGPSADGRSMLLHLCAWHLWHEREH